MIESLSKDIYESYKAHSASSVDTLKAYKSKMTTLENQIANLTNALANGATFDSIYTKLAELEHQKGILEFEIKREEKSASNALSIERIKELLSQGLDMHLKSDKEKATLINTFVESIAVGHDDELKVRLNFKTDRDVDAGGEGYSFLSLSS
jgi:hypothetical protein